jgi:hypothetical protein
VRPVSQRRLNYLFSTNKDRNKWLSYISSLWVYHYPPPCHHSFGHSLSHQFSYFIWSTQGTVSPPTMLKIMGRAITKKPTCRYPLRLLLSKCWLCKHRCFKPCNKPWSACMHNPKCHHRRGIGSVTFSALSTRWMLMIGSNMLTRSCKWYSATIVRRCC